MGDERGETVDGRRDRGKGRRQMGDESGGTGAINTYYQCLKQSKNQWKLLFLLIVPTYRKVQSFHPLDLKLCCSIIFAQI